MRFLKNLGAAICIVFILAVFLAAAIGFICLGYFLCEKFGLVVMLIAMGLIAAIGLAAYWTMDGGIMF